MTSHVTLDLAWLSAGTRHLSQALCGGLVEAAVVLLEECGHKTGVALEGLPHNAVVSWASPDPRAAASNADPQDATEFGATAIAILLVKATTPHEVIRRSRKGTGFDWFVGPADAVAPFAGAQCLEVSGILAEDDAKMKRRLDDKVRQIVRGGQDLPGYAVVVGFTAPCARIQVVP